MLEMWRRELSHLNILFWKCFFFFHFYTGTCRAASPLLISCIVIPTIAIFTIIKQCGEWILLHWLSSGHHTGPFNFFLCTIDSFSITSPYDFFFAVTMTLNFVLIFYTQVQVNLSSLHLQWFVPTMSNSVTTRPRCCLPGKSKRLK